MNFFEKLKKHMPMIRRIILVFGVLFLIATFVTLAIDDTGENPARQIFTILFAVCFCTLIGSFILPWLFMLICYIGRGIPAFFCAIPGFFAEMFKKIGKLFARFFKSGLARVVCEECSGELSESNVKTIIQERDGFYRDRYGDLQSGKAQWLLSGFNSGKVYCIVTYTVTCPHCGHEYTREMRVELPENSTGYYDSREARRAVLEHLGFKVVGIAFL